MDAFDGSITIDDQPIAYIPMLQKAHRNILSLSATAQIILRQQCNLKKIFPSVTDTSAN